jgi:hypothetical protein
MTKIKYTDDILLSVRKMMDDQCLCLKGACKVLNLGYQGIRLAFIRIGLDASLPQGYVRDVSSIGRANRARWADPVYKERRSAEISAERKAEWKNSAKRRVRTQAAFDTWADPEKASRILAGHAKPGVSAAKGARIAAAWADPESGLNKRFVRLPHQAIKTAMEEKNLTLTEACRLFDMENHYKSIHKAFKENGWLTVRK